MALLESEIQRIKYELGYHLITIQGEPYIGFTALFEQVIQPYLQEGADTTALSVVGPLDGMSTVTIELADGTGFKVGQVVIIDTDDLQERATVRALDTSGPNPIITVRLEKDHDPAGYPVTVEGGLTIIRSLLTDLRAFDQPGSSSFLKLRSRAGVKKVDEIEFFGDAKVGFTALSNMDALREYLRKQLATALNVPYLRGMKDTSSNNTVLY